MTTKEIVRALRCTSTPGDHTSNCEQCQYWKKEQLNGRLKEKLGTDTWTSCDIDKVCLDAADLIEHLTAENADLRKELEWKDMVIAIAQRKQAKAEAERAAALEDLADARSCKTCKYACDTRDCSSCKSKTCKCRECHLDKNAWEWRGLPEAPEEGEKDADCQRRD